MNRVKKIVKYAALVTIPMVLFYLEAFFTYNPFVRTRWRAQVLNIVVLELVMLILLMLVGRASTALQIETFLVMVIGIANYYVISFRSNPIVPWDILSVRTAASVAGEYSYALPARQIILILIFIGLIVVEHFVKIRIGKKVWFKRLLAIILSLGVVCGITWAVQQDTLVSKMKLYPFLFTPNVMYERNGFAITFLMDLQYLSISKPEGYDADEVEKILESYNTGTSWTSQENDIDADKETATTPNIIVVMDEAFSDLSVLGDFASSEDYMPFLHSLQEDAENTVTGYLNVSVKGGNTANTEFEFLTGDTMAFLPTGSIPYQQYITDETPSLASYLKTLGYSTYAMHPYYATGWNRDKVYPLLGFDTFLTQSNNDFTKASYLRGYVDDSSCVDKIIETYENKKEGTPAFIFNVTMQNHSPYTDGYVNADGNISVEGSYSQTLSEYLTLIKLSDTALQYLVEYFETQEEPTVIVFFGDHQPTDLVAEPILSLNGMSNSTLTTTENELRYEVPYVIWANYDIDEASNANTSANFLAVDTLKYAGVPLSDYQNYLLELQKEYPIISGERITDAQGNDVEDELEEYRKMQYYLLFD